MEGPRTAQGSDGAEDHGIIRPVGYQPRETSRTKRTLLTRGQVILICVAVPVLVVVWFLFTAKSVRLEFTPIVETASISGGLSFELGGVYLLREGPYQVTTQADGYYPLDATLQVTSERNQSYRFSLVKLPGVVTVESTPPGATISLNGVDIGTTPAADLEIAAGRQQFTLRLDRYQPMRLDVDVTGLSERQAVAGVLLPDWAEVTISSEPAATVFIDDESTGVSTPGTVQVMSGEHEISLSAPGHKSYRQRIVVAAQEQVTLGPFTLEQADSLLRVSTSPGGAGVTLNGQFQGETPLELAIRSNTRYRVQVFKAGYAPVDRSVTLAAGGDRSLDLPLTRLRGDVVVVADPGDAELYIDGKLRGRADQTISLTTAAHKIEIRKTGYAGYSTQITPRSGLTQEVKVRLLTLEEARLAALRPVIRTAIGQELVLVEPTPFSMGASRRQPGRRANETLRDVDMSRLFYIATKEVTNAEFKQFARGHDSGSFEDHALNKEEQPAVRMSWTEAALFCNWLSDQDDLPHFYLTESGKVTGINPRSIGYRLPTEAEWAWSYRQVDAEPPVRFPWGASLPPPDRFGNFADRTAAHLVGRVVFGYNDNYIVSAPPGTFPANLKGLYDMPGNVSEWISDFYEIPGPEAVSNPLGPQQGEYRVIRGSSWMHGTITELRISFRDYGVDGRQDLGFRLARFAEPD